MKTFLSSTIIALSVGGGAFAGPVSGQIDNEVAQVARQAGIDPQQLSATTLTLASDALRDGDRSGALFYLQGGPDGSGGDGSSIGAAQFAAELGLEPGVYTTNELVQIEEAMADNDTVRLNFLLAHGNRASGEPTNPSSPGKAQLAAQLGVNPADFTLAELTTMWAETLP